jgi:hypothetical protein
MKPFRLSFIDYYFPLSHYARQSNSSINRKQFDEAVKVLNNPEWIQKNFRKPYESPFEFDKISLTSSVLGLTEGQKTTNSAVEAYKGESFEELFNQMYKFQDKLAIESFSESLKNDTQRLIVNGKVDLHYISKIYEILCYHCTKDWPIWEFYDELIWDFLWSFEPSDLIRILLAYNNMGLVSVTSHLWIHKLSNLTENALSYFTNDELSVLVFICDHYLISHPPGLIQRLNQEKHKSTSIHYFYFQIKYQSISPDIKQILNFSLNSRYEFACMFFKLRYNENIFNTLIESICEDKDNLNPSQALKLFDTILHSNSSYSSASKIASRYQSNIKNLSFIEYKNLLEILSILKNMDQVIHEDFLLEVEESFFRFTEYLNYQNISSFIHFFSYSMPIRSPHEYLCNKIINAEKPDTIEEKRPSHIYYIKLSDSQYLVYNNSLLTKLSFVSLRDLITSLPFRYQVSRELWEVLRKYMKLNYKKFFHFNFDKYICKMLLVLSKPENFDKELIDEIYDKLYQDKASLDKHLVNYVFFVGIKNMKNLEYHHPAFIYIENKLKERKSINHKFQ